MKYKLAIFDLDGTVLDTLDDLYTSVCYALEQCGYPARTKDEVRRLYAIWTASYITETNSFLMLPSL